MILQVRLVSHKEKYSIFLSVHLNFIHPKLNNAIKRCDIGNVEDEEDTLAASIVCAGDGSEPLLSGSVPDLKLDAFIIDGEGFEPKVDSDGGQIVLWELVLYESDKNSRLSDSRVANNDSFKKVVVLLDHSFVVLLSG